MASAQATDPRNPNNITTPLPSESAWSNTVMPPILGCLDHAPDFFKKKTNTFLKDPTTNKEILDADGNPIKDFANIPPCISTNVEPWRVEAYFRLHGDFTYNDLWARQPTWQPKPDGATKNKLNNLRARTVRVPLNMRAWSTRYKGRPPKTLVETVESLDSKQLDQNTTWDITPRGIVQPGNPNHILPFGCFLNDNVPHTPSKEVVAALELSRKLQAKAAAQGKRHWSELSSNELPEGWMARLGKSRVKVETPGESNMEGDPAEMSEEEPHGKEVSKKARKNQTKKKSGTSDESSDEPDLRSDLESEEEPLEKRAVWGPRAINMSTLNPSDGSREEAVTGGEEVVTAPNVGRRSRRLKASTEYRGEDMMEGRTAIVPKGRNTLERPVNMDHDTQLRVGNTGGVLEVNKRRVDEPLDDSGSKDQLDKSTVVKVSLVKGKRRRTGHAHNSMSDPEPPSTMAGTDAAHAPNISLGAPNPQTARTIYTAESLRAMLKGDDTLSDQIIHEMLTDQAQHKLSEATIAFVFSGFVPSPSSLNSQPPPLPNSRPPPPAAPTSATFQQPQAEMNHNNERAQHWAKQKEFIETEKARLALPMFNPTPSIEDARYGAYDQQWYHPKPELSKAEQERQLENTAENWYHERPCQLVIEELRQASMDKGVDFYNDIAMELLMSDVKSREFAHKYYAAATKKVNELAAENETEEDMEGFSVPSTWFENLYHETEGGFGADFL
ncbi:hypothetical protein MMC30_002180 [Trapelia coarctata]|nr:hypothetical protein [Trapelia coarctata]